MEGSGNNPVMSRLRRMTHATVSGPRGHLAKKAERPLAKHTPLSRDSIRTAFGALFLFLSLKTVVRALRAGFKP
jgi:hypothetical protein